MFCSVCNANLNIEAKGFRKLIDFGKQVWGVLNDAAAQSLAEAGFRDRANGLEPQEQFRMSVHYMNGWNAADDLAKRL